MIGKVKQRIGFKLNFLVMATLLLFSSVSLVLAGNEPIKISDWQIVGPSGGDVRVVAVDHPMVDSHASERGLDLLDWHRARPGYDPDDSLAVEKFDAFQKLLDVPFPRI